MKYIDPFDFEILLDIIDFVNAYCQVEKIFLPKIFNIISYTYVCYMSNHMKKETT